VALWRGIAVLLGLLILNVTKSTGLLLMVLLAVLAWRRGTRLASLSASQLRLRDRRRPVLYFRSFLDEKLNVDPGVFDAFQIFPRTLEMVLADVAWHCGPVVCIGKPGEPLPPLGFARESVSSEEWRLTASRWIDEARIVLVVAGPTAGLAWEMNTLAASRGLERVVVVIPPVHRDDLQNRWTAFLDHLTPPVRARLARVNVARALVVVFPPDGEALAFTAPRRGFRAYEVALQTAVAHALGAGGDLAPPAVASIPSQPLGRVGEREWEVVFPVHPEQPYAR
jgi:hypothetical protein